MRLFSIGFIMRIDDSERREEKVRDEVGGDE